MNGNLVGTFNHLSEDIDDAKKRIKTEKKEVRKELHTLFKCLTNNKSECPALAERIIKKLF